jgi:DNA-binding XRE family transcriptional regulator
MTATALAAAAGVTKSFISQLESGRTSASIATLERIASALQVPASALLAATPSTPSGNRGRPRSRLLHARDVLPSTPGTRLLSDAPASAHAVVTVAPGGVASGLTLQQGSLLVSGLRGTVQLRTRETTISISAGDIAEALPGGEYELVNQGYSPATVLVSATAAEDLPRVGGRSPVADAISYDAAGPFRLVTMRARRAAERVRQP